MRSVVDPRAYRLAVSRHGRAAALTPRQLADCGLDVASAEDWRSEGVLEGTLLCRAWSGSGAMACAYIEDDGGKLWRVALWRGSAPYRAAVLVPYGTKVAAAYKAASSGRAYCALFRISEG